MPARAASTLQCLASGTNSGTAFVPEVPLVSNLVNVFGFPLGTIQRLAWPPQCDYMMLFSSCSWSLCRHMIVKETSGRMCILHTTNSGWYATVDTAHMVVYVLSHFTSSLHHALGQVSQR